MLILLSLLSCFAKMTAWRSGPPQADYDGMTFSEPRLVFGSTFGSRRARFLRVVFIGGIQVGHLDEKKKQARASILEFWLTV